MIKELKDYLLMDWWKVADALAIFSGYVPLEDYTSPLTLADSSQTRFIRISDGRTALIDYQEFNRIKKLWLASDYDSLHSDDFRSINSDRLDEEVKKHLHCGGQNRSKLSRSRTGLMRRLKTNSYLKRR